MFKVKRRDSDGGCQWFSAGDLASDFTIDNFCLPGHPAGRRHGFWVDSRRAVHLGRSLWPNPA